jgi:hypothetical protein
MGYWVFTVGGFLLVALLMQIDPGAVPLGALWLLIAFPWSIVRMWKWIWRMQARVAAEEYHRIAAMSPQPRTQVTPPTAPDPTRYTPAAPGMFGTHPASLGRPLQPAPGLIGRVLDVIAPRQAPRA